MGEKFWNILAAIAIIENTVLMFMQGGIWILFSLLFGGFWLLLWRWECKKRRFIEIEHLLSLAHTSDYASFSNQLYYAGLTVEEFREAIASIPPGQKMFIGDPSCMNNARSPCIRCAINPCGPCENCPDFLIFEP